MKKANRDLLVLFKQGLLSPKAMDMEVNNLHELLFTVEKTQNLVATHELIDLNVYKIQKGYIPIIKYIRQRREIPFVFLNSLN
jgi:hypothetical protein